jgi:hypothetical protein
MPSRVDGAIRQATRCPKNLPCPKSQALGLSESLTNRLPRSALRPPQKELFLGIGIPSLASVWNPRLTPDKSDSGQV